MTLHIHRGADVAALAEGLAGVLSVPQPDPLAAELVIVPARGVERWLAQRLAHRLGVGPRGGDGVCAGVTFLAPRSFLGLVLGIDGDDPWTPDRLVWPILRVLDEALDEPWLAPVARHLGHGAPGGPRGRADSAGSAARSGRRYALARHVAGLVAGYAAARPGLVADWRRPGPDTDGLGGPLDDDLRWQAELYRRLVARVPADPPEVRHAATCAALAAGSAGADLPPRLSLFGHTRLARTEAELLGAVAAHRDVHVWLPQASPALWGRLAAAAAAGPVPRADDDTAALVAHPLLGSLARDARELQRTLALAGPATDHVVPGPAAEATDGGPSLLRYLQGDLRADRPPDAATRAARRLPPDDYSVTVHACHGPARQVEVLRDVLSGLLEDDPTLQPRDILIMCPDIEAYAPLFQAAFGLGDAAGPPGAATHPAHTFRVRLADRALSATNPLFTLARTLLDLVGARVTASQVLDLLGSLPVRRRFHLDDDDLGRIGEWVDEAGIRWGLDAAHRAGYRLGDYGQNTWRFGLDRLLVGVAARSPRAADGGPGLAPLAAVLPVDDVDSGDLDLLGRLVEAVDRLDAVLRALADATALPEWLDAVRDGVAALAVPEPGREWQADQLDHELEEVRRAAGGSSSPPGTEAGSPEIPLRLADVRHLLQDRLGPRPTRANFRTGSLTVATMVPMRSVPHRVVALVGLDDGVFPRSPSLDGDDVLARRPLTGERDARSEDRQLLLDAVMAARDHLVITYTGASEHHGLPVPPAVPLGELIDALDDTATPSASFRRAHPLQPFDARALDAGRPFSFDRAALAGARAAAGERTAPSPFLTAPLPARPPADAVLADVRAFFAHPARAFLRQRLGVAVPFDDADPTDAMPVELDALERWGVGDRLLADALLGVAPESAGRRELLRGVLPPAALGQRTLGEVGGLVEALVAASADLRAGPGRAVDIVTDVPALGAGGAPRRLAGTVGNVVGTRVVLVTYSSLGARQRLASWLDLLALSAANPDVEWTSHVVARRGRRVVRVAVGPVSPHVARTHLAELLDVYDRGLREPIPLPAKTAFAYAQAVERRRQGEDADPAAAALREWSTGDSGIPGEAADAAHVRVYGPDAPLDVLLGPPAAGESWNRGVTRLGQFALRVAEPLLRAERFGDR